MKEKMLYIMNVDWNWIKQRPHYLAEELSEKFDITIVYQYRYGRKGLQKRDKGGLIVKPIYVIPRLDRSKKFAKINTAIKASCINNLIKKINPTYIYVTFPDQITAIPDDYKECVIYDCMDNHLAFIKDRSKRNIMEQQERNLYKRANFIMTSSEKLKEVLQKRYGDKEISVIRNGYNGNLLDIKAETKDDSVKKTICYFGTISTWFNFDFLLKSLSRYEELHYLLIGPVVGVEVPRHPRIKYIGTVEHFQLQNVTNTSDCFMMPFVVNEIIESVDPVKLYEYINFNRNILCVKYPEVERFEPYVHFFTDFDSYCKQIELILKEKEIKYSSEQRIRFLENNSWRSRKEKIIQGLIGVKS